MATITKDKLLALRNEILMAEKINEEELEPIMVESLARYTGTFIPRFGIDWDIVLNEVYPIIQNNLPSIFFRNPKAYLKPRNKTFIAKRRNPQSGEMEGITLDSTKSAKTQEALLNYNLKEMKYKRQTRKVLLDALLFPHGVLWHGYKGDFGMTEEQSIEIKDGKIFVTRVPPLRFIYDPAVTTSTLDEARWVGRILDVPLNDILEDDRLDVDKRLKGFYGFGNRVGTKTAREKLTSSRQGTDIISINALKKPLIDFTGKDFRGSNESRFLRVYEIYLRPTKKDKRAGKKGKILLLIKDQSKPLRVNDWTIKAEGLPARLLQFNELNDNLFGLNDIDTYSAIADQKNVIINLQIRNAQENSKVWVGISKAGTEESDLEKIRRGEQTIILFEDGKPSERMYVASPGGQASSELYLIDQRIQKNLEDKSGVTDLKRGFLQSGEESAASVKIRSAGGSARPQYRQDIMSDFLMDSFHYLNQLDKQFFTFKDAVRILGRTDIEWSDNFTKDEIQADTDVEIDAISMLPENPEKELRELNTLLSLMIQGLGSPEFMEKIATEGKIFNFAPLIDQMIYRMKIRDPEIFRNIRPEESQGFVSVQQIREAKENVDAALKGGQVKFPPKPEDDHLAKLEVYTSVKSILDMIKKESEVLNQLIQIHTALLQEMEEKETKPNQVVRFNKPTVETV